MEHGPDKRKYKRANFKRSIKYSTPNLEIDCSHIGQDISSGGIRMNSNEFIAVGSTIVVQVKLDLRGKQYSLPGKVKWVRYLPHSDNYQLGVEFLDGSRFEKGQIEQYVVKKVTGNALENRS